MLKKIKLNIESHIDNLDDYGRLDTESESTNSSYTATMRISDGEIILAYKESDENGTVSCTVSLSGSTVSVRRNGAIVSTLVFDESQVYKTVYLVPPYKFDMEVKTLKLTSSLSEHGGDIDILYDMTVGGARKRARMKITACEV